MKTIAKEVGVSRATVSFVLNERYKTDKPISADVVKKIQETAKRLGYVRNELVHSIVSGKSRLVAIIADFSDFMMPIVRGFFDEATRRGYSIKLISINGDINKALLTAVEARVEGIHIFRQPQEVLDQIDQGITRYGIPINGLDCKSAQLGFDQEKSAERAAEYLVGLGLRNIACVSILDNYAMDERVCGYRNVMRKHQLMSSEFLCDKKDRWKDEFFDRIIDSRPDGVFCTADPLALTLLNRMYRRRLFVPDTFSVVGFGNISMAATASPALTTIEEPYYEIGCNGFENIYHKIQTGKEQKNKNILIGSLVVRESTIENHKQKGGS